MRFQDILNDPAYWVIFLFVFICVTGSIAFGAAQVSGRGAGYSGPYRAA